MIINKDTNPEKDLYYIGGLILQYFIKNSLKKIDCHNLVQNLKNEYNMSSNIIFLSLDWLYILGSVDFSADGEIMICF